MGYSRLFFLFLFKCNAIGRESIVFFPIAVDYGSHPQHWLLFDRIVQQIVLQSEGNDAGIIRNPDVAPIEINVKEIVHLLAKEEELVAARKKAEELERENSDMSTRLAKKEQELDLRTQEKVIRNVATNSDSFVRRCLDFQRKPIDLSSRGSRRVDTFTDPLSGRHGGQPGEGQGTSGEGDVDAHRDQTENLGATGQPGDPVATDQQRKVRKEAIGTAGSLWKFTGRC